MASTVWRGYITFGLISIPVRLFRAARAERVPLRRLYKSEAPVQPVFDEQEPEPLPRAVKRSGPVAVEKAAEKQQVLQPPPEPVLEPVRQASVHRMTEEVLPERSVVKGFEYEKNRFVALDPDELKSIAPKTATEMQIEEFVNLSEVDPVYFETSYYVVPEDAGQKAYGLLYKALQTTALVAVAQVAMHSREHVVILRPGKRGIIAHTMFFTSEVRGQDEYRAETSAVSERELKLAETLIHSLAGPFEPEKYRDSYREKLEQLISAKVNKEPVAPAAPVGRSAPVVDITEALQKSLAALKRPPVASPPQTGAKRSRAATQA